MGSYRAKRSVHGDTDSRLYRIWHGMRARCNTPSATSYRWYGAKGIAVCADWDDFTVFRSWALANGYTLDLTIDRKDKDGDYCPENCEWIPASENFGKDNRGEANGGGGKLTEADVRSIRKATGTQQSVADRFGVSRRMVRKIRSRESWKHVV